MRVEFEHDSMDLGKDEIVIAFGPVGNRFNGETVSDRIPVMGMMERVVLARAVRAPVEDPVGASWQTSGRLRITRPRW